MRAVWSGRQIAIEGDPDELALLAPTLSEAGVDVQHTHTWTIAGDFGEDGVQRGACACGEERTFVPWAESYGKASPTQRGGAPAQLAQKAGRKCGRCGKTGHTQWTCPLAVARKGD